MEASFRMNFVTLEGTPRERGRVHGEALRSEITRLRDDLEKAAQQNGGHSIDDLARELVEETGFVRAVERWAPDLLDEVKGIAEGAGLDFKTAFAMQLLDESGWFFRRKELRSISNLGEGRCSALGVFGEGDGPSLLAQTADMGVHVDGFQTVLHIKDSGSPYEAFVFTIPGVIGVYGLNNHGVGVCLNAMGGRMNKSTDGLGTIFVSRGILARSNLDDAVRFVRQVKHASGENYTIGGPDSVVAYECSANKVSQFIPYEGATRVYHTNHPLVNDDIDDEYLELLAASSPAAAEMISRGQSHTETRFSSLEERLTDTSKPVTMETIRAILSSHDSDEFPICRHKRPGAQDMTSACLIMELSESPVFHVAPGPPCMTQFRAFEF